MDDGAHEMPALVEMEADQTSFGQRPAEDAFRGPFHVAEHLELAAEELREEDGQLVVRRAGPRQLPAQVRTLGVGVRPVLDPALPSRGRVGVARDVTDRIDVLQRGAKALVDDDPVVDVCARLLRELDVRLDADSDDREVGLDRLSVVGARSCEEAPVARELLDLRLQTDVDTLRAVELDELGREIGAPELGHQRRAHLDLGDREAAGAEGRSRLGADEAATDHDRRMGLLGRRRHRLGVRERPVRVDADAVGAGNLERPWASTRRDDERAVRNALTARELDLVLVRVDRLDGRLEPDLHDGLLPLGQRLQKRRIPVLLSAQESLRQRRPVIRRIGLR